MSKAPQRILVTGGSGFVGAALVRKLLFEGRQVSVLLRNPETAWRLAPILPRLHVMRGELGRLSEVNQSIHDFEPEAIAHLAWEGVKGVDRNSPVQMANVSTSIDLYRLTDAIGGCRFVGLGSQAEYGMLSGRIGETAPTRPTTAYGAAKLATGLVLERTAAASGRAFAWLRLFSSYGPEDDPSWLIPYLIRSLLAGQRPSLTKAEQVWDYVHVDDVAAAVIGTLDAGACGIFNLGSGQARPLREIMCTLRDAIDPALPLGFGEVPYRPDQVMHLESDISALMSATSWRPQIPLDDGLAATVAWHRGAAFAPVPTHF